MMKKLQILSFLSINIFGFAQIPNFPTIDNPNPSSFQNYSNQTFTNPNQSQRNISNPVNNSREREQQQFIQKQNERMMKEVQDDMKRTAQEEAQRRQETEQLLFESWVDNGRNMSYDLPSLSGKTGTQSYYDALNTLSSLSPDNYSISEANFIVENAFYENKQDFNKFKSGIKKTAKQLLQKMKERKQDTDNNTSKNLMIHEYFSKDMNLGGVQHKAFKYDFEDYMGGKDWSKMFVSKLLKTGSGQCHSMPLYYLMLAEEMNTEAYLAYAPNHSYIKFKNAQDEWENIELTNGIFTANSLILESGYIKSEALQNNIYMKDVSKKEVLSQMYADLANGYAHKYGMDEFVEKAINKSLEYAPNNIHANLLKSMYQQARFMYVLKKLGIRNAENPQELQNIRFFPKAIDLMKETKAQYNNIDNLGYMIMPEGAYEEWMNNMSKEANKQKSEAIAERVRQLNAEKQKQKQLELKKAQEQKKKETPKYFPIDPNKL